MSDLHLYEYATLRYVPSVEREEFINVGLVMMCKRRRWLRIAIALKPERIAAFDNLLTVDELSRQLEAFAAIGRGEAHAGPIAELPVEERFRWLTAVKSTCIQSSRPHPGHTADLDATFDHLYRTYVL